MKLKKLLVSILAVCMALSTMGTIAFAQETEADVWDGESYSLDWLNTGNPEGTTGEAFYLDSAEDLAGLAYYVNTYASTNNIFTGDTVYLNVDVDLDSHEWSPIGSMVTDKNHFYGSFNGQGHTISNLKISKEAGQIYGGLFGRFKGSNFNQTFSNLTICGVDIATVASTDGKEGAGALMGYGYGQIIDNVHVTGNVNISGNSNVGGLAGHSRSNISNSTVEATGSITGVSVTGGLVGYFVHATGNGITAAINACAVKGVAIESTDENAGGLVGFVSKTNADQIVIDTVSVSDVTIAATNSESGNSVASVAQNFNATNITVVNVITSVAGEKTTPSDLVAQVGGTYYTDFEVAIANLADGDTLEIVSGTYDAFEVLADDITITGMDANTVITVGSTTSTAFIGVGGDDVTIEGLRFVVPEQVGGSQMWITSVIGYAYSQWAYGGVEPDGWDVVDCEFVQAGDAIANGVFNCRNFSVTGNHFENFSTGIVSMDDGHALGTVAVNGNTFTRVDYPVNLYWGQAGDSGVLTITGNTFASAKNEETVSLRIDDYATRNVDESTIAELTITGNTYTAETEVVLTDSAADTNVTADETANVILNYSSTAIADENLTEGDIFYINYGSAAETKAEKTKDGIMYTEFANEEGTDYIAYVNDQYHTTIGDALAAADAIENGVVWLLPGEFTVGDVQFPASLTDVTIRGAADKSTVLKDSSFRSADGNAVTYTGITIDGIVFDNSNLVFTGQRSGEVVYSDWTITNCVFRNIERDANYAAVHFNTAADEAMTGFTFTNNEINGVTGSSNSGLNMMSLAGTVLISGNTIQNVAWNAMQLKNADVSAELTVSDNVISDIGAEEGIFNLSGFAGSKTFAGNTVTKSSDTQAVFCYVNGGITLGEGNTWLDAAGNEMADIGFTAAVGDVYYVTRDEAFAAAAAGETVSFLTDVEITVPTVWTKNVDLNDHMLTITADGSLTGAVTVSNGTIEVKGRTGDAAIGGISLLDVLVLAMEGGNVFAIAPEEAATWEDVNADVTGAETGLSIAAGGQLTICGESMVLLTDSTVSNLTVQGALTITDPAILIAPGAVLSDGADISGEVMEGYTEAAVITPDGGTFKGSVEITITCPTEGAAIYYTTNGETPTIESTPYTEPFILSEIGEWSVCAIAVGDSMLPSEEVSAAFVIEKKPRYKSSSTTTVQPPEEDGEPGDAENTENKDDENADDTGIGRRKLPFIDVPEDYWGYDEIADCYFEGIMTGMTEITFEPETPLTRGMLVTMLYRLAGSPKVEAEGTEWYAAARAWAMETGVSDGTNMDDAITREQLVTMLYRYGRTKHTGSGESLALFTDAGEINDWALEAMDWAVKVGLVTGMGDGTVAPQRSATRAQVAAIFARYMKLMGA